MVQPNGGLAVEDIDEISRKAALEVIARTDRLAILANDREACVPLPHCDGFVLGTLFRQGTQSPLTRMPDLMGGEGSSYSVGERLLKGYWGGYIAAWLDGQGEVHILRDPSGAVSAYFRQNKGSIMVSSDLKLLVKCGLLKPSVDWHVVADMLFAHQLGSSATAICGLEQIMPGSETVTIGAAVRKLQLWSPQSFVDSCDPASSEENARELESVVKSTIAAWSSVHSQPLLGVSGGLDSSIVAASLVAAGSRPKCFTLITDDPGGNESEYARLVTDHFRLDLDTCEYRLADVDLDRSVALDVPVPSGKIHEAAYNAVVRRSAQATGARAFFTGVGGDNVFYLTHSARPVVDRYMRYGLSNGLLQTLRDVSRVTGASYGQVTMEALRVYRARSRRWMWRTVPTFLHADVLAQRQGRRFEHPWMSGWHDIPPGKQGHIVKLLRAGNHLEHRDKMLNVPVINPLLSQPVLEMCLRFPTWQSVTGGIDRSIARRAFSNDLPRSILQRREKGGPDGFTVKIIRKQRPAITERLLDGILVSRSILDRRELERTLSNDDVFRPDIAPRIMTLLDAEAWARYWTTLA
ncbi:asparagine synthetase B family protein [Sphingobium cupriresistens]|uniref:asparagine synthase-related protein n=1 Tax=Sphingobium cupriresistens TaxID=1132417 RepID=UPI001A933CE6|nr:asparagine synthetase B family protein [Sphingobium cupriresistens]